VAAPPTARGKLALVPRVLVSNNSELLRHFASAPFRRLDLELVVAASGDEALGHARTGEFAVAVLDAELIGPSGYDVARTFKSTRPATRVVLVTGKRLVGDQMRRVAECGCDEVLVAPMTADELFDVVAIQLGAPRRGAERYDIAVDLDGQSTSARVSNLSVDGARLIVNGPVSEGQALTVTIVPQLGADLGGPGQPVAIRARVVWAQAHDAGTVVGAAFESLDDRSRELLARLTQWEIVKDSDRTRVVLKGDFTEATRFDALLTSMVGRVDFDMAQVTYMNSIGVRSWCQFLRAAPVQGYEFHACSVPFVLQASLIEDVTGRGTITSFFAPYHCDACDRQEEKLLQTATILASALEPPTFTCPCGAELVFDDLPERYFAFLQRASRG
jgi:DNA-binding response OmpR family regulator/anti-anti-sigma regulatory factor